MQQATLDLLAGCDIQFRRETRLDIALVKNLPIALIFLPAADIPTFVGEGRVDLGITGRDQIAEHDAQLALGETSQVEEILDLGFGGCKLQVQVPEKGDVSEAKQLVGRNVVTSFTALTEAFFAGLESEGNASKLARADGGYEPCVRCDGSGRCHLCRPVTAVDLTTGPHLPREAADGALRLDDDGPLRLDAEPVPTLLP